MKLKKLKVLKVKATLLALSASFASIGQTTLSPISIDVDENTRTGATVGQVSFVDGKPTRTIPIEVGKTTLSNWSTLGEEFESIPFSTAFSQNPLVFGQIQSSSDYRVEYMPKDELGGRPGVRSAHGYSYLMRQRIDNVSATGFEAALESQLDLAANTGIKEMLNKGEPETFGWLAVGTEAQGVWTMSQFEALATGTSVTHKEFNQDFSASFDSSPTIISSITTYNGSSQSGVGVYKLNKNSADIYIDEIDDNEHPAENVNILAVSGNGFLSHADDNLTESVIVAEYGQVKIMDTGIGEPFEIALRKDFHDPVVFVQAVGFDTHIYDAAVRLTSIDSKKFTGYLHSNLEKLSKDRFDEFTLHYQVFEAGDWEIPLENYDYEIISGNETGAFVLDHQSGKIKVADQTQLDFESGNNQFIFTVRVTDGLGNQYDTKVTINVNDINDSLNNDAQTISGLVADDWTGWSVAPAGDFNGDGFDDIIVGSPQSNYYGNDSGVAIVLFSDASGTFPSLNQVESHNRGILIIGAAEGDNAGFAVAGGVDINGDGLSDVVVGAPYADVNGKESGATYVVFGKADNADAVLLADLASNNSNQGYAIYGAYSRDLTGGTLVVGDVNGDGLGDVVIGETIARSLVTTLVYEGSSFLEEPYPDPNMAYVVYGKKDGKALNLAEVAEDDNTSGYVVYRSSLTYLDDWQFGAQVLPTGDFNSDGLTDFIVNRGLHGENSGVNKVVYGRVGGTSVNYNNIKKDGNGINIVAEDGFYAFDFYTSVLNVLPGFTTSNVGDVNADGIDDIALLLTDIDCCNDIEYPRAYILFGGVDFSDEIKLADIANGVGGFIIHNDVSDNEFHSLKTILGSIGGAGDLNGDGFDDIIIGDPYVASQKGRVYTVYGRSGTDPVYLSEVIESGQGFYSEGNGSAQLGQMIASAGDVNADGIKDIQFGVPSATAFVEGAELSNAGSVYVLHGDGKQVTHWGTTADDIVVGDANGNNIATGAGDDTVTGNGGADAIYTGPGNDTITISDVNFVRIDGGGGTDTIKLTGSGQFLNLAQMSAKVRSVEVFDIRGAGSNELSINKSASGNSNIRIIGDADDTVYAANNQWQDTGTTRVVDNVTYQVYQVGDAEMLVQVGVSTEINNAPTIENQSFSIVETATANSVIGTLQASANDVGDFVTFSIITNNADDAFAVNSITGELSISSNVSSLDYEESSSHAITVQVIDQYGEIDQATITINVNDVQSIVNSFEFDMSGDHSTFGSNVFVDLLGLGTQNYLGYEAEDAQSSLVYSADLGKVDANIAYAEFGWEGEISFEPSLVIQGGGISADVPLSMELAYSDEIQVGQETLITTLFKYDDNAEFLAKSPSFDLDLDIGFRDFTFYLKSDFFTGDDGQPLSTHTHLDTSVGIFDLLGMSVSANTYGAASTMCSAVPVYSDTLDFVKGLDDSDELALLIALGELADDAEQADLEGNTFIADLDEDTIIELMTQLNFKEFFKDHKKFDSRCLLADGSIDPLRMIASIEDDSWYEDEIWWGSHWERWAAGVLFQKMAAEGEECQLDYFAPVGEDLYKKYEFQLLDTFISARVGLKQDFYIDIRPLATLTLEDGTQMVFRAEEDIKFTPELHHDVNNDGIIDADITVEVNAVFSNESDFLPELYFPMKFLNFGYELQEASCDDGIINLYGKNGMHYDKGGLGPYFDFEFIVEAHTIQMKGFSFEEPLADEVVHTYNTMQSTNPIEIVVDDFGKSAGSGSITLPSDIETNENFYDDYVLDFEGSNEFLMSKQTVSKRISFDLCSNDGACGEPILSYKNNAPTASNIQVSGNVIAKQTITASYEYDDNESDPEGSTVTQWYIAADAEGSNAQAIVDETSASYTLTTSNVGNYVRFCVTPHDGSMFGLITCSDWQQVESSYYKDLSVLTGFGQAMVFDGATQSILQPNNDGFNPDQGSFTIEAWLNVTEYNVDSHNNILTYKTATNDGRAALRVQNDGSLRVKATDTEFFTAASIDVGKWHHVAITFDNGSSQLNVYVDGENVLSETDTSTFGVTDFVWGSNKNQGNSLFNGKLDEVRVWKTAKTQQQVQQGMLAAPNLNDVDLFSYINFDVGTANSVLERVSGASIATKANANYEKHLSYASFDGRYDYIEVPDDDALNFSQQDFTAQAWFYVTGNGNRERPIVLKRKKNNSSTGWGIKLSDSEKLQFSYSGKAMTSEQVIVNKQWYHVAVTVDRASGIASMYINGVFEKSLNVSSVTNLNNSQPLRIGKHSYGGNFDETFKGYIDDVAIWNRALTQSEIQACMSSMQRACGTDLVAFYDFEGANVDNKAQNQFHGAAYSGAKLVEEFSVNYHSVGGQTLSAMVPVGNGVYFEVTSTPIYGTWSFNKTTGAFDYTPHTSNSGKTDSFSYIIYDANDGYSSERTVTITIE